jgi:hypothetical protein
MTGNDRLYLRKIPKCSENILFLLRKVVKFLKRQVNIDLSPCIFENVTQLY